MELLQTISLLKSFKFGHTIDDIDMIVIESAINLLEAKDVDFNDLK